MTTYENDEYCIKTPLRTPLRLSYKSVWSMCTNQLFGPKRLNRITDLFYIFTYFDANPAFSLTAIIHWTVDKN